MIELQEEGERVRINEDHDDNDGGTTISLCGELTALRPADSLGISIVPSLPEEHHSKCRQDRKHCWNWLAKSDGSRDGRASKDDRSQQAQFDAVRLVVLESKSSQGI